ncbi:related to Retrovirus-related POL polyprotein [Sporisorium scitamineum]|uniref:Related to Retrovirus-related POL polyprotein n=1 Tax=Sporisorium scitamineum TaxID=49012 RepID=A0A0F7SCX1_9BASI|nr:related to Retrovirus-related POL polyprotein [Sporisorium scitamineum]CDW99235.1 hypothetical protein [Sporisorium scitamineum]
MDALGEAPLVFHGSPLQRHLVGPILPRTALVVEVSNFSENEDIYLLARTVALYLMPFAKVHDVWTELHSIPGDTTLRPANKMVVLAETTPSQTGARDPAKVQAIPGYINLGGQQCELHYIGRLPWCTTCRSNITQFHSFDNCPRRRCYNCNEPGHSAALCPRESQATERPDPAMAQQQANETASDA